MCRSPTLKNLKPVSPLEKTDAQSRVLNFAERPEPAIETAKKTIGYRHACWLKFDWIVLRDSVRFRMLQGRTALRFPALYLAE